MVVFFNYTVSQTYRKKTEMCPLHVYHILLSLLHIYEKSVDHEFNCFIKLLPTAVLVFGVYLTKTLHR